MFIFKFLTVRKIDADNGDSFKAIVKYFLVDLKVRLEITFQKIDKKFQRSSLLVKTKW